MTLLEKRTIRLATPAPEVPYILFYSHSRTPAYISQEDADLLNYKWYLDSHGRLRRTEKLSSKTLNIQMHTEIAKRKWPDRDKHFIDHKDGNPSNNTRDNLRQSGIGPNSINRFFTIAKSGHIGIYYRKDYNLYRANFRGKEKSFKNINDAIVWRKEQFDIYWSTHE